MFSCVSGKNTGNIVNFDIYFLQEHVLRSHPVYNPGEEVCGYAIVTCKGKVKIEGIEAKIFGRAEVSITGYREYETQEICYVLEEKSLYDTTMTANDKEGNYLQDGFHRFKFRFRLPEELPSTFTHIHGSIKYSIKAVILKPFVNQHVERFFTVHSPLKPSDYQPATPFPRRIEAENFSSFCYWLRCFPNGHVGIEAQTDKNVYAIGEVITITCVFKNATNSLIVPDVTLKQRTVFTANGYERSKETIVACDFIIPNIEPQATINFIAKIEIPKYVDDIPLSSTLTNCPIINVTYYVEVALRKACVKIPVIIDYARHN